MRRRRHKDRLAFLFPHIQNGMNFVWSGLGAIAKAVSTTEPVAHFVQGYCQFWHVPMVAKMGEQTQHVMRQSIASNITTYLVPCILYQRLFDPEVLVRYLPKWCESRRTEIDCIMMLMLFLRLYARRTVDNFCYATSLPRVVANDLTLERAETIANGLTDELLSGLNKIFFRDMPSVTLKDDLSRAFKKVFYDFFARVDMSEHMFNIVLKSNLKLALIDVLNQQELIQAEEKFIEKIAELLAEMIVNEFSSFYLSITQVHKLRNKSMLTVALSSQLGFNLPIEIAEDFATQVNQVRNRADKILPAKQGKPCGCGLNKTLPAMLSSSTWHIGNKVFTKLPDFLLWRRMITWEEYLFAKFVGVILSILIYGQSLNEYKVPPGLCTRHRYRVFARNKMHNFGLGLACVFNVEIITQFLKNTIGVEGYFIRDAIENLVLQLGSISTLTNNEPLPGKKMSAWDFFSGPRWLTRQATNWLVYLFLPNTELNAEREKLANNIKRFVSSVRLHAHAELTLGEGIFFPTQKVLWRYWEQIRGNGSSESANGLSVVLALPSVKIILRAYHDDIESRLDIAEKLHTVSARIAGPLLSIPILAMFLATFSIALRLLEEPALKDIIEKLYKALLSAKFDPNDLPLISVPIFVPEKKSRNLSEQKFVEVVNKNELQLQLADAMEPMQNITALQSTGLIMQQLRQDEKEQKFTSERTQVNDQYFPKKTQGSSSVHQFPQIKRGLLARSGVLNVLNAVTGVSFSRLAGKKVKTNQAREGYELKSFR